MWAGLDKRQQIEMLDVSLEEICAVKGDRSGTPGGKADKKVADKNNTVHGTIGKYFLNNHP